MKKLILSSTLLAFVIAGIFVGTAQNPEVTKKVDKNAANAKFEKEIHDFGVIPKDVPATFTFVFKNTGKQPLIITRATASCGCTTPEWTKEPIKKGGKGFIKATYNAASIGPFTKVITVESNGVNPTISLTIKGEVKAPEYINPSMVDPNKK